MYNEENIAILMADLSGYSALTETHGAVSAADLIDKYLEIVQDCLVGDSKLQQRTGDEVMIISPSADHLLLTAFMLMRKTSREDKFLQVHGGLHYGKILQRHNSYFGSTINLTARITTKASPGTFWCSGDFINALANKTSLTLKSKGRHKFKNITEEKDLVELTGENKESFFIDPVCRMLILNKETAISHPNQKDLYFCSTDCLTIHQANSQLFDS